MGNLKIRQSQAERSEKMQNRVLAATLDSIYELGFRNATTMEVAKRAGVSRGALLHHFPTKEALISAAVASFLEKEIDDVREMAGAYANKELTLDAFVDFLWSRFSGKLFMITLDYLSAARTDDELKRAIVPASLRFHRSLNDVWSRFFVSDERSAHEIEVLLNTTLCLMRGMGVQTVVREDRAYFEAILDYWKAQLRDALQSGARA